MSLRAHIIEQGHKTVDPSTRMLRYWWGRINKACFDSVLLPPQITYGAETLAGYTTEECDGVTFPLGGQRVRIHIADSQTTRQAVLATLAHEMIHQWQYQHNLPMDHGQRFDAWQVFINLETGLTC